MYAYMYQSSIRITKFLLPQCVQVSYAASAPNKNRRDISHTCCFMCSMYLSAWQAAISVELP